MTWQQGVGGWQRQQSGASSSSGGAPQVQQYAAKELDASGDQVLGASGRARIARQWDAAALSTTRVQSWSGWTQPKPNSSSQVSQQLQQVAAQLQSVCGNDPAQPKSGRACCRVLWVRRGHTANQASGESSQQPRRGCPGAGICEENAGTATRRVEDTAESTTTVEQEIGKCEGCSAESSKESGGKRELRSLWPRLSLNRRTKKQREFKSNSARSNKKLTKQLQKPQAHAHSTAARLS